MNQKNSTFWSIPPEQILREMETTPQGLTGIEAQKRLKQYGFNLLMKNGVKALFLILVGLTLLIEKPFSPKETLCIVHI